MLKERNVSSISILYDKYAPAVYGTILKEIGNTEIAKGILERTFLDIWTNPSIEIRFTNHVLLWLLKTAKIFTTKALAEVPIENVINEHKFSTIK